MLTNGPALTDVLIAGYGVVSLSKIGPSGTGKVADGPVLFKNGGLMKVLLLLMLMITVLLEMMVIVPLFAPGRVVGSPTGTVHVEVTVVGGSEIVVVMIPPG